MLQWHRSSSARTYMRAAVQTNNWTCPYRQVQRRPITTQENVHDIKPQQDELDQYLNSLVTRLVNHDVLSVRTLFQQYQDKAGTVASRVVPYEERPSKARKAQNIDIKSRELAGDGLVLVVHAEVDKPTGMLLKTTVCSGFVVDASLRNENQGDTIITCAHTLHEMHRYLTRPNYDESDRTSFSFIVSAEGIPRVVTCCVSSMPRSDVLALEVSPVQRAQRLRSLPLSPFPVYTGTTILTHLFGSSSPPHVQLSIARTRSKIAVDASGLESPLPWIGNHAWRRWGAGLMLGYRSYTGLELEAGISSVLPHILTSVLPTSGSSGGPLVYAETGAVVGMTSGRRMDNRVEGERGWGCSAESIFEMFSLPGFTPVGEHKHPYP